MIAHGYHPNEHVASVVDTLVKPGAIAQRGDDVGEADHCLELWNVQGNKLATLQPRAVPILCVSFSQDRKLASETWDGVVVMPPIVS